MQEPGASNQQEFPQESGTPSAGFQRPPRPEAPGASNRKPRNKKEPKNKQDNKDKKPGRIRKQAMPVIIMTGLIVGLLVVYSGVRAAREALSPQAPQSVTLPQSMGSLRLGLPSGWKSAQMQNVARASGRWGLGKPGSTKYAFFVTRYPLRAVPGSDAQKTQVLREAQSSMVQTGAQGKALKAAQYKNGDSSGWKYHFVAQGIDVQIWLLIHTVDKRSSLYQFACQSPPGKRGQAMRGKCQQSVDGIRFSKDRA